MEGMEDDPQKRLARIEREIEETWSAVRKEGRGPSRMLTDMRWLLGQRERADPNGPRIWMGPATAPVVAHWWLRFSEQSNDWEHYEDSYLCSGHIFVIGRKDSPKPPPVESLTSISVCSVKDW